MIKVSIISCNDQGTRLIEYGDTKLLINPVAELPLSSNFNQYLDNFQNTIKIITKMNISVAAALFYFSIKQQQKYNIYLTDDNKKLFDNYYKDIKKILDDYYQGHAKSQQENDQLNDLTKDNLENIRAKLQGIEKFKFVEVSTAKIWFLTNMCIFQWLDIKQKLLIGDYISQYDINEIPQILQNSNIDFISMILYKQLQLQQFKQNQLYKYDLVICQDENCKQKLEQIALQTQLKIEIITSDRIQYNIDKLQNCQRILIVINKNIEKSDKYLYDLVRGWAKKQNEIQLKYKYYYSVKYDEEKGSKYKQDEIQIEKLDKNNVNQVNIDSIVAQLINYNKQRDEYDREKDLQGFQMNGKNILILSKQDKETLLDIIANTKIYSNKFNYIEKNVNTYSDQYIQQMFDRKPKLNEHQYYVIFQGTEQNNKLLKDLYEKAILKILSNYLIEITENNDGTNKIQFQKRGQPIQIYNQIDYQQNQELFIQNPFNPNINIKVNNNIYQQNGQNNKIDNSKYQLLCQEINKQIKSHIDIVTMNTYLTKDDVNNTQIIKKATINQSPIVLQNNTIQYELKLNDFKSKIIYLKQENNQTQILDNQQFNYKEIRIFKRQPEENVKYNIISENNENNIFDDLISQIE